MKAVNELACGKILCGDVGTGKSITALAYYYTKVCGGQLPMNGKRTVKPMTHPRNLLVITTARKRDSLDWEREMARFGLGEKGNYNGVKTVVDSWNNIGKYEDTNNWVVIFDEQRVVGSGAWVKSFLRIAKDNHWILLSATPGDVWSDYIPVFIANGFYKNKTAFTREHCVYSRFAKYPKIDRYVGTKKLEMLRKQILVEMPMVRKTVRHNENVFVDFDADLYKRVVKDRWNVFEDEPVTNVSVLFSCMRRVVNGDPSRLSALGKLLQTHSKLIVFYNFDYELEALRKFLQPYSEKQILSVGEWNGHKHESIPSSDRWVYLVQYSAGAEAWNCIETNVVVFYSLNYSYRVMQQCKGRIDRLNTPFTDLYYFTFRSRSGIDFAILKALREKRTFNERSYRF